MSFSKVCRIWEDQLQNTITDNMNEKGEYVVNFIDKEGNIAGHFTTHPGEGVSWAWPEEALEILNKGPA